MLCSLMLITDTGIFISVLIFESSELQEEMIINTNRGRIPQQLVGTWPFINFFIVYNICSMDN